MSTTPEGAACGHAGYNCAMPLKRLHAEYNLTGHVLIKFMSQYEIWKLGHFCWLIVLAE